MAGSWWLVVGRGGSYDLLDSTPIFRKFCKHLRNFVTKTFQSCPQQVKSVQSALSDLLTTSTTHGTFSRPSRKRGLILIGLELNTNARESFDHC